MKVINLSLEKVDIQQLKSCGLELQLQLEQKKLQTSGQEAVILIYKKWTKADSIVTFSWGVLWPSWGCCGLSKE
ncbi:hypothetical protein DPMN_008963 [Dreissena polymorpha]|uniref:Uncharacterized protein n=1 Tax=Dreissena polymorpha TaxID=45954 RepID=A0A9D4MW33_DREPO|nr:hypothetical protein DPMN_008963 [Dreissena polymorpha]